MSFDPESGEVAHRRAITADMVRAILDYDRTTGFFFWRVNRGRRCCMGRRAGGVSKGRWRIRVFGKLCEASNLAWLHVTGSWPAVDVDHRDRDATNDSWGNLREATRSQNCMNKRVRRDSSSGEKGVVLHRSGLWRSRISAPGVRYDLGLYRVKEQAGAAYRIAAAGIHGEYSGV